MVNLESKIAEVPAGAKEIFEFLLDMHNFEKLLPKESVSNFVSDGKTCSFKMHSIDVHLMYVSSEPYTKLSYGNMPSQTIKFTLNAHLNPKENHTEVQLKGVADVNSFLEMIVKKPLTNLFEHMSSKLISQFENK